MKLGFPSHSVVKNRLPTQETWVWSLGWEDPLERERATHSSFLAWEIPWTEEPGRLQYMELQKRWASWATTQQQGNEITVKPSERQGLDSFQGGEHIQALRGWCLLPPPETCPASFWFGCVLYDKVAVINAVLPGLWVILLHSWSWGESLGNLHVHSQLVAWEVQLARPSPVLLDWTCGFWRWPRAICQKGTEL